MALTCKDCPYCYKTDEDCYPHCQFESLGTWDKAPCEYDDEPEEEPEDYSYLEE